MSAEKFKSFLSYEEIPPLIQQYVAFVAGVCDIKQVSLVEINEFLAGLFAYETEDPAAEWEDGWVL